MPLQTGQIINNRYRIVKLLGVGGFGAVYRAWDLNLTKPCALKENLEATPASIRQFTREAVILAALSHPNLPRVTDHFSIPGQGQYLVMDFIEGEDLEKLVERQGPLPPQQAISWISQIVGALSYLHSRQTPVLHRDVKPANIRIAPTGQAILVDFGLVKECTASRTTVGGRAVTPGYSPPEQYGQGITDVRSDVYALGATLYMLITGIVPIESIQRIGRDTLRPAHQVNPLIPIGVGEAVTKAMNLSQANRFQSVADFEKALRTPYVQPALPQIIVDPQKITPPKQRSIQGRLRPWIIGCMLLLSLVCTGFLSINLFGGFPKVIPVFLHLFETQTVPAVSISPRPPSTHTATYQPIVTATPQPAITHTPQPAITATPQPAITNTPQPTVTDIPQSTARKPKLVVFSSSQVDSSEDTQSDLFLLKADGTISKLINDPADDWGRAWSPDGLQIAFTSDRSGNWQLYVLDLASGDIVQVTNSDKGARHPAWSLDGNWIAFNSRTEDRLNAQVCLLRVSSRIITLLTSDGASGRPTWSPDGRRLAFNGARVDTNEDGTIDSIDVMDILTIDINTKIETNLTNSPAYLDLAPAYSPDGNWIVFSSYHGDTNDDGDIDVSDNADLYLVRSDGLDEKRLTYTDDLSEGDPYFITERQILYIVHGEKSNALYMINLDGSGQRQLLDNYGLIQLPAVAP